MCQFGTNADWETVTDGGLRIFVRNTAKIISKEVAGRGPGPRRPVRAMVELTMGGRGRTAGQVTDEI
jgi:hypothetical protein